MPRVIRRINIDCNAYFMEATRACRFRIYPDDKRQNEIYERLVLAKEFYNLLLERTIKSHKEGTGISMAALNRFINMLSYKAESAGMKVIMVDARDTTQECSSCHYIKKGEERLTLEDRTYHCNVCGMAMDRDVNASINILHRATTLGQRGSHAQGESVRPQREAVLEELRTYPANNRGSLGL